MQGMLHIFVILFSPLAFIQFAYERELLTLCAYAHKLYSVSCMNKFEKSPIINENRIFSVFHYLFF